MSDSSQSLPLSPGLLIAVIGPPGSGKTRLLAEVATWQRARGARVDGFVAGAGEHPRPREGADCYRLNLLATGEELPWAVRDESCTPPYRFEPATRQRLLDWAAVLPAGTALVLLDEFGRIEARGDGLMALWPALMRARPGIVVMAVRAGAAEAVETHLGRRFDLRIAADAPDAFPQLRQACADYGEWTRIGLFGGASGGVEMTLGTALHAAKLPLRGLVMSSLQAAMMVFTCLGLTQPGRVIWVPFVSAGLKAFSPGGSRLRPMLAIAIQGLLFGTSVQLLGANVAGFALGGLLVGAWSAMQGILLQYLMLGGDLFRAYDAFVIWLADKAHVGRPGSALAACRLGVVLRNVRCGCSAGGLAPAGTAGRPAKTYRPRAPQPCTFRHRRPPPTRGAPQTQSIARVWALAILVAPAGGVGRPAGQRPVVGNRGLACPALCRSRRGAPDGSVAAPADALGGTIATAGLVGAGAGLFRCAGPPASRNLGRDHAAAPLISRPDYCLGRAPRHHSRCTQLQLAAAVLRKQSGIRGCLTSTARRRRKPVPPSRPRRHDRGAWRDSTASWRQRSRRKCGIRTAL